MASPSPFCFRDWMLGVAPSFLPSNRILLLDGGVSTHLEELLQRRDDKKPSAFAHRALWSSSLLLDQDGQALILQGHKDWLEAGSNVLSTVTYQCHYEASLWPDAGLTATRMDALWQDAVGLAQTAVRSREDCSSPIAVVASSGCYGAALANGAEYTGDYGDEDEPSMLNKLVDFHKAKLQAAGRSRPDGIAIETVPSLLECRAVRKLMNDPSTHELLENVGSCYVSLACRNGHKLNDGSSLRDALDALREVPASSIQGLGLNCCDSQHLCNLVETVVTDMCLAGPVRTLALYPNSGEVWDAETGTWREDTGCQHGRTMAHHLMEAVETAEKTWRKYRPTEAFPPILVGGCCRTRPDTIRELRKLVDKHLDESHVEKAS